MEKELSTWAENSKKHHFTWGGATIYMIGHAYLADGALPLTVEGEISGSAGELGRGKLMAGR